ncbi:hypothetical protein M899_3253 [Bacteriovorax sp. BSW11_IV]|uniref:hypothetical protein n=1 Tax=Bacteriovorax sp. BSW11_IV TaxID=1353529 RepID=UPI00038A0E44|nr:hypothetical protein [Bacteriovorax sp. BSW11_IV]EQC48223.1 hypothetical protein M899_3253 [Bacteriovorax sp. BSW11_IV]
MKNAITLLSIMLTFSLMANSYKVEVYTFEQLNKLEKEMEAWANKVGQKDLIVMGKMDQKPKEIETIRLFFPYLLPKEYLTYNIDMTCAPSLQKFRDKKDLELHKEWEQCVRELYATDVPPELEKALKELRPKK